MWYWAEGDTETVTANARRSDSNLEKSASTVLDALADAILEAERFNANDQTAPAAIIWCDPDAAWSVALPRLRTSLPIVTFGEYDPTTRTGPAIWLRYAIERPLAGVDMPQGTPIVYLPGLESGIFRSATSIPKHLEPLAELRFRGSVFRHQNGRDWTPRGFLQSHLKLNVREDYDTARALEHALELLLDEPVADLARVTVLDASALHAIVTPDPVRELLNWLNADAKHLPALTADKQRWKAFVQVTKSTFGLDPERDGQLSAAVRLIEAAATPSDPWNHVWERYREAPRRHERLPELLRSAAGAQTSLFSASDRAPNDNERDEEQLRTALMQMSDLAVNDARDRVRQLETEHGPRRTWVWADLGAAPLATALELLAQLAERTATPLGSGSPAAIAERYAAGGWETDRLALAVIECATDTATYRALCNAVNTIYRPWLEDAATAFQTAVQDQGVPELRAPPMTTPGRCILFTDGLRYDIANDLATTLRTTGHSVTLEHALGALPGVTATAKPAVSPARDDVTPGSDFNVTLNGTTVTATVLRRAIAERGFQILSDDETGDPSGAAWTEYGNLDAVGHADGAKLAHRLNSVVRSIADRVQTLLEAGWSEVTIITDHGWLLLPGSLPTVQLPQHLTTARKGRCARLKPGARVDYQTVPWTFDPHVRVAVAPGIGVFVAGNEYEHGGISVQENVLPVVTVRSDAAATSHTAQVTSITWTGLRVRVDTEGAPAGAHIDIRTKASDDASSIAPEPKPMSATGQASLIVPDEDHEGTAAFVVVLDNTGRVIAQRTTVVGEH